MDSIQINDKLDIQLQWISFETWQSFCSHCVPMYHVLFTVGKDNGYSMQEKQDAFLKRLLGIPSGAEVVWYILDEVVFVTTAHGA